MTTAQLLTPWIGSGQGVTDAYRPKLAADYSLLSFVDVTGQPAANLIPTPNAFVVEVTCDDTVWTQIQADANYSGGILWWE